MRCLVTYLAITLLSVSSATGEKLSSETPTRGYWRGVSPGTWVVYKYTRKRNKGSENKIEYAKRLLYGTDRNGFGRYGVYESDSSNGKWGKTTRIGGGSSFSYNLNSINNDNNAKELIAVGDSVISCYAITNKSERWDERSVSMQWVDADTGMFIKTRTITTPRFADAKFNSKKWSLDTNWRKHTKLQERDILLYSQTMRSSQDETTWHITEQTLSPDVPGWQVSRKEIRTAATNTQVEFELELIKWGEDRALLKEYLENLSGSDLQIKKSDKWQQDFFRKACMKNIKQLSSENDSERLHASQYLAQNLYLKDNELIENIIVALLPCLDDPVQAVQRNTARALGNLNGRGAIARIEELLRSDKDGTWYYINALLKLDAPLITEDILLALEYENPSSRVAALQVLKGTHMKAHVFSKLIELSQDDYYGVRKEVYEVIGASSSTNTADIILRGMEDDNKYVRAAAYRAAGKAGDTTIAKALIDSLSRNDKDTNGYAINALLSIRSPSEDAVNAVCDFIDSSHKDSQAKILAISLLGKQKRREAVPTLINLIRKGTGFNMVKKNGADVTSAVFALGRIKDKSAVPHLLEWINDPEIGEHAISALTEIGDARAAEPLLALYKKISVDDKRARTLLKGISACGDKDFTATLQSYFNSCPPDKRQAVWSAIKKSEGPTR